VKYATVFLGPMNYVARVAVAFVCLGCGAVSGRQSPNAKLTCAPIIDPFRVVRGPVKPADTWRVGLRTKTGDNPRILDTSEISFKSMNTDVLSVDSAGMVTAVGTGTAFLSLVSAPCPEIRLRFKVEPQ
jgi:hypothetical protein